MESLQVGTILYYPKKQVYVIIEETKFVSLPEKKSKSKVKLKEAVSDYLYTCAYLDGSGDIRRYYNSRILSGELEVVKNITPEIEKLLGSRGVA